MQSLVLTFAVILISLCLGYALQRASSRGKLAGLGNLLSLRKRMQSFALFVCMPVSAMLSLWGMPSPQAIFMLFPFLGLLAWLTGGLCGLLLGRCLQLSRQQAGAVFCCASLSNIAGIGGLVCVLFFGEQSIALVALYRMCEEFYYFGLVYPVAQSFSPQQAGSQNTGQRKIVLADGLRRILHDKVIRVILLTLSLGFALNILGVPRPALCGTWASGIMIMATMLFLTAIGMSLRFSRMGLYTRPWLGLCCIKFVCVPVVLVSTAWLAGLGQVEGGLPLKVVCVLSAMPVAMNALVPPTLFDLDVDLANTCWIGSTAALLLVLPLLLLLTAYI